MRRKKNIALIYGGYSSEEIISRKSAEGILSFIEKDKYNVIPVLITKDRWVVTEGEEEWEINKNLFNFKKGKKEIFFDCAYITIHGSPGENGFLQGYLEMAGVPYTTCNVLTSSLTFNKYVCNNYLKNFNVNVAEAVLITDNKEFCSKEIVAKTGLPCFVKPNAGGSSFGISKVHNIEQLKWAIEKAFKESNQIVVEEFIEGKEVTCGLYKTAEKCEILPLTEIISKNEFFDFEAKYTPEKVTEITPARLNKEITNSIMSISSNIYDILQCRGIIRIDYIIKNNTIYMLEVNTTPGMTKTSFIPQQIKAKNLNIGNLFSEIIEDSIKNSKE
ncbi:D-alanine--D-alanine ligase [Marinilabiliaceae bacterium ANBcel2]|nr:D-alanine--D-alanine ligase [Marinilabiliaceae bacterium ANBcel2]